MKHRGLNTNRLPNNPMEQAFAEKWEKIAPHTLGYIICGQNRYLHDYSQRDAEVAASVIQWLGSLVGQGFLHDVQGNRK